MWQLTTAWRFAKSRLLAADIQFGWFCKFRWLEKDVWEDSPLTIVLSKCFACATKNSVVLHSLHLQTCMCRSNACCLHATDTHVAGPFDWCSYSTYDNWQSASCVAPYNYVSLVLIRDPSCPSPLCKHSSDWSCTVPVIRQVRPWLMHAEALNGSTMKAGGFQDRGDMDRRTLSCKALVMFCEPGDETLQMSVFW